MVRALILFMALFAASTSAAQTPLEELDVMFELVIETSDTLPLEGEMVLATLRGEYRETIANEDLKLRRMTDFDWIQLAPDRWTEQVIDGLPTVVLERRIALFPKRSGELTILPIAHELELVNKENKREIVNVRSKPVSLEVVSKPVDAGSDWLPVRAMEFSETWSADPKSLVDGQLVERRVVLRALGVTPELLPEQPAMREPWLITFTPPEERNVQNTKEGPVSTVVWVWKLRPITGEPGVISEVSIPYFDTTQRQAKSIVIPAAPIGYASFSSNDSASWQAGFRANGLIWTAVIGGMLVALVTVLQGMKFTTAPIERLTDWNERRRAKAELKRLEKLGDVAGFRTKLMELLSTRTDLGEAERLEWTSGLDALIFENDPKVLSDEMSNARRAVSKIMTSREGSLGV